MARNYPVATSFTAHDKGVISSFRKMGDAAGRFGNRSEDAFSRASKHGSRFRDIVKGILAADILKRAGSAAVGAAKNIFTLTGEYERFAAVLKNTLGDEEKAAKAMGDIQNFAASTPFQINELIGSYIKLTNRGLQPTMEQMTMMGDIASSQGKSFDQLTEAILDATSGGGFERLKEFGIKASKSNGMVELSFKNMTKRVADSPAEIQKALLAFGKLEGVQGGMAAISETLEGRTSNLQDTLATTAVTVGKVLSPFIKQAIGFADRIAKSIKNWFDENKDLIRQRLEKFVAGVVKVFNILAPILSFVFSTTVKIVGVLAQWAPLWVPIVAGIVAYNAAMRVFVAFEAAKKMLALARMIRFATIAQWALNVAMTANPVGLVIAGIAALIAIGVLLYQNWGKIKEVAGAVFGYIIDKIKSVVKWFGDLWGSVKSFFTGDDKEVTAVKKNIIQAPNQRQEKARASQGRLDIDMQIAGAPVGSSARARRRSRNVNFNAKMMGQNQ